MYKFNLHMAGIDSWMSVKEAATYLGKSPHWLYQNRERLKIPCTAVGGTLRFEKSRMDEWISSRTQIQPRRLVKQQSVTKVSLI